MADLVIRNARLRPTAHQDPTDHDSLVDIVVEHGRIAALGPTPPAPSASEPLDRGPTTGDGIEIDAAGGLVTESFVDAHLHLDKVFTASTIGDAAFATYHHGGMAEAGKAIDTAAAVKLSQDPETMLTAGRRAVSMAGYYGTTHIRALADVDSKAGLRGVEVLCALREEFAGEVVLQVVAFAQDGIVREPGTDQLLADAMESGADVVGGIPWIEANETDMGVHCDVVFDIAVANDAPVSMLLDDVGDPALRTLEMMARRSIERGWHGRALAHHARAMALYPDEYLTELLRLLIEAEVAVVADPHTGPLHARVRELIAAGVTVCFGQDDMSDAYYAFGRHNMLEVAFLAAHLLWAMDRDGREMVYDGVTTAAAEAIGVSDHRLEVGGRANLVVLPTADTIEALRFHPAPNAVIANGRVLDRARYRRLGRIPG